MNQTIKSSILLISLLGVSFFAFNFLSDSLDQQSEISQVETTVTSTTIQKQIEINRFNALDISLREFIDSELLSISDECIKFGSWFSLTENCLNEWLSVLKNIDEKSSIYASHYAYAQSYFISNYQNLNEEDVENIIDSLSIESDLAVWNEKLTLNPGKIDKSDVQKIKEFGYVDKEVSEIVQIISYFNYINRVADGLGLEAEDFIDEKGYKK